jgi:hypothetical protein
MLLAHDLAKDLLRFEQGRLCLTAITCLLVQVPESLRHAYSPRFDGAPVIV